MTAKQYFDQCIYCQRSLKAGIPHKN